MMTSARKAKALMKQNRYSVFKERALTRPKVREAFEEGLDVVRLAASVAELREKRGLTHLGQSQTSLKQVKPSPKKLIPDPQSEV
jgi:hypothetical protein